MEAFLKADKVSMVAALGAGVVLGVSGIYYYYKVNKCVTNRLNQISGTIDSLRREIEELKLEREKSTKSSPLRKGNTLLPTSTPATRFYSYASSLEDPDEEFFDFTDTEDAGAWASFNGSMENLALDKNADSVLDDLDVLLDSDSADRESVYKKLCSMKDEFPDNAGFLWRLAKATHLYGIIVQSRGDLETRKLLAFEAFESAKQAYEIEKSNPEVHKWYAITIGSLGDYVGAQERIVNGHAFKEHVDEALRLKPEDPSLHYMLGRWCYEVASLSWLERKLASTLFSTPPESTLAEARDHLLEAERLKPNWKENLLYLAKSHIGEGDYGPAMTIIDRAISIPVMSEDDNIVHIELETLQDKYQTYREEN